MATHLRVHKQELYIFNEYQHDSVWMVFKNLHSCALDESSLSIGRDRSVMHSDFSEFPLNIFSKYICDAFDRKIFPV